MMGAKAVAETRILTGLFQKLFTWHPDHFPRGVEIVDTTGRGPIEHKILQGRTYQITLKTDSRNEHLTYEDSTAEIWLVGTHIEGYLPQLTYTVLNGHAPGQVTWLRSSNSHLVKVVADTLGFKPERPIKLYVPGGDRETQIYELLKKHMGVK